MGDDQRRSAPVLRRRLVQLHYQPRVQAAGRLTRSRSDCGLPRTRLDNAYLSIASVTLSVRPHRPGSRAFADAPLYIWVLCARIWGQTDVPRFCCVGISSNRSRQRVVANDDGCIRLRRRRRRSGMRSRCLWNETMGCFAGRRQSNTNRETQRTCVLADCRSGAALIGRKRGHLASYHGECERRSTRPARRTPRDELVAARSDTRATGRRARARLSRRVVDRRPDRR